MIIQLALVFAVIALAVWVFLIKDTVSDVYKLYKLLESDYSALNDKLDRLEKTVKKQEDNAIKYRVTADLEAEIYTPDGVHRIYQFDLKSKAKKQ